MIRLKFILLVLLFVVLALFPDQLAAQCAMCKATNGSALDGGGGLGINEGIVYLMGVPYLLLGILGYLFFRKKIGGFLRDMREIHD